MKAKARPARPDPTLSKLAARLGIQTSFVGMGGQTQFASARAIQGLLELWGISARNPREGRQALSELDLQQWRLCVEPVRVAIPGERAAIRLRLPASVSTVECFVRMEDGTVRDLAPVARRTPVKRRARVQGQDYTARDVLLPALPPGYHEFIISERQRSWRTLVVCAPTHTYSPPEPLRLLSAFLPMYAAHSEKSWGAGNLSDWRRLAAFIQAAGGRVLSTLPLTAQFLGQPICEPSPYSPASRLFWNEFYLDIERLPQFADCKSAQKLVRSARFQAMLNRFRRSPLIDYPEEAAARREVLSLISTWFFRNVSSRHRDLQKFLQERPDAREYAHFRATCERAGSGWPAWESRQQHGKIAADDYDQRDAEYHLYAQWQMERQMAELSGGFRHRGMELYLDLPVGVHPDSFDVWRQRDVFALPASVGAPPDPLFTTGQNWGFAPLHPQRLREQRYKYFIEFIRFQMRHVGLLRIDHVMGLHRLFWIPPGLGASDGAYVSYPAEELQAILSLESHRNRTLLVGENLGIVPPEVTRTMNAREIREIYVMQFEQRANPAKAVRQPPVRSVASLNTHDMPMFAAHWTGTDVDQRAALDWVKRKDNKFEKASRAKLNTALTAFLKRRGLLKSEHPATAAVLRAALAWLATGPAEIVQVNLEDLWGEVEPQNIPGTSSERPNWRRKAALSLEQLESSSEFRELLSALAEMRASRSKSVQLHAA